MSDRGVPVTSERSGAARTGLESLALHGGRPVRERILPYGRQIIEQRDLDAVTEVLRSDWLTTGPVVEEFERGFAAFVGAAHAVAVNSGTAALHAAAFGAGVRAGDEVIVPALTFAASANCARYLGADVVFADVRADTLTIDIASVKKALSSRTKAIVAVDYGGQPADLDELLDIAESRGLTLIEDAAHGIGSSYRNRSVGAIADFTTFSLHPVKQMTTGEGGIVTTQDPALAARLRAFRSHGIATDARQREAEGAWYYEMSMLGYNYRLTDFQSALGLSQLSRLPGWLERRRQLAQRYSAALASYPGVTPLTVLPDRSSSWHLYVVRFDRDAFTTTRTEIFAAMRAENIGVNVHYIPVPWHPYYAKLGYERGGWPAAEAAYEEILTLPLWAGMTDGDADDVVAAIGKVHAAFAR